MKKIDNKWLVAYLTSLGIPLDHFEKEGTRIYFFFSITPEFETVKNDFYDNQLFRNFINEYYKVVGTIKEINKEKNEELTSGK